MGLKSNERFDKLFEKLKSHFENASEIDRLVLSAYVNNKKGFDAVCKLSFSETTS